MIARKNALEGKSRAGLFRLGSRQERRLFCSVLIRRDILWFGTRVSDTCSDLLQVSVSRSLPMPLLFLVNSPDTPKCQMFLWQNSKMLGSVSRWVRDAWPFHTECSFCVHSVAGFGLQLFSGPPTCRGRSTAPAWMLLL